MVSELAAGHPDEKTPDGIMVAPPPLARGPSAAEQEMLTRFDAERRLGLLRIIVPVLLVVTLIGLLFSIQTDMATNSLTSSVQAATGLAAFIVAFWATWRNRANLASYALFAGIASVIVLLLLSDAVQTPLDVTTLPEFALLVLPILVAGIFGGQRLVIATTLAAALFTLCTVFFAQHTAAMQAMLQATNGPVAFTIPISVQLTAGTLVFASNYGYRRTQRELGDIRVAYAREKELDRLKDQFISSVNHELRTPIMALQGYIEIAQELGARGEVSRQVHILERSADAADHLATLVRSALSVSRIEADAARANPQAFRLLPTVLDATKLLDPREAGDRERELRIDIPEELEVFADQDHVRQVILNLLSNASKYSEAGSSIEVSAHVLPPTLQRGRTGKTDAPQFVEVAVRDHGLGIPPIRFRCSSSDLCGWNATWLLRSAVPAWGWPFASRTLKQ
jgi:signal transduction histidine kinase